MYTNFSLLLYILTQQFLVIKKNIKINVYLCEILLHMYAHIVQLLLTDNYYSYVYATQYQHNIYYITLTSLNTQYAIKLSFG